MSIKSLVSLFLIFLFVSMLISFSSFVSAEKKFDVSVRVVEGEIASIEKETITPQKIVTGLVSLSFKDKNNIILSIVVILIIVLIVYIIIRKKTKEEREKRIKNE